MSHLASYSPRMDIKQRMLLSEVLNVKISDEEEVVNDQKCNTDPFESTGCIHSKDDHETKQLEEQSRLQDAIIP